MIYIKEVHYFLQVICLYLDTLNSEMGTRLVLVTSWIYNVDIPYAEEKEKAV